MRRRIAFAAAASIVVAGRLTARAEDWPLDTGNQFHTVYSTYGQYYEAGGGLHLHEGLDIAEPADTAVFARTDGKVLGVQRNNNDQDFMTVDVDGGTGWNFVHMTPGDRPKGNNGAGDPGGPWAAGDTIKAGNKLGVIAAQPANSHPTHLHV